MIPNAVNFHVDQYLYIFLALVRYSAVYCNSFQCGMAVDVFPEKERSLLARKLVSCFSLFSLICHRTLKHIQCLQEVLSLSS